MTTYNAPTLQSVEFNKPNLNLVSKLFKRATLTVQRKKALNYMKDLPDYLLSDIGVTRGDVTFGSGQKLWNK